MHERRGEAGNVWRHALLALLATTAIARADPAKLEIFAKDAGAEHGLVLKTAVDVTAKVDGRLLTIAFASPVQADLAHIADLVAGYGRFVRQSADGKTLSITLTRELAALAEKSEGGWQLRLAPPGKLAPAAQAAPAGKHDAAEAPAPASKPEVNPPPAPAEANGPAKPELTVSEGPDYTRLTFAWPRPTDYEAQLVEGELMLTFKSPVDVRLADLRVTPPKRVRGAVGGVEHGAFVAKIRVDPGVTLRHAKDDNYVIVDLLDPPADASAQPGAVLTAPPAVIAVMAALQTPSPPAPAPEASHAPPPPNAPPDTVKSLLSLNDIDLSVLEQRLSAKDAPEVVPAPAGETAALPELQPLSVAVAPSQAFAMAVALDSRVTKLSFPWGEAVPAAVVRRGDRLWIAFAREADIDVSQAEALRAQGVIAAQVLHPKGATIIGLKLADRLLATAIPEAGGWTIALGETILAPTPDIALERRAKGRAGELAAKMPGKLEVVQFQDPDIGDNLLFVMAGPPARGFVSTRHLVDFDLLAATQGVVVKPLADGIGVRLEPEFAVITSDAGLHIAGTSLVSPAAARASIEGVPSPAQMKFAEWRGPESVAFTKAYQAQITKIALAEDADRPEMNVRLARLLMGHGLYEEALGALKVAADEAPQLASEAPYRTLRGIASLLAGRVKDAKADLDTQEIAGDPDTSLWIAMLASAEQDYPRARIFFTKAGPAIVRFDAEWQARMRLRAAEAGLEINDFGWARDQLDLLPSEGLAREQTDEAKLLRARLSEVMGDPKAAVSAYAALSRSPIEPVSVKAQLASALLATKQGKLAPNEAIDRLESLRFEWRGDAIEAQTLLALGQVYAKVGDFRHALSTMRIVVRQFPGTPNERRVYGEMADLFEQLFLNGKADKMPPIQALALYFDFKELTPVGPKGDVMIRRLCDRLVAMDLLDQATELLKHQVDNRLIGAARSQVAARLALVQLMNHKPEDALATIHTTRQARLPDEVSAQRRLIEARALMDLSRYEHALDVLSSDSGPAVDRLRADIYWHAEDWAKAGPALEQGLGQAFAAGPPLTDAQRFDIMRAAISYALGNDSEGLARVKQAYAAKMHRTVDAHAFDVVTSAPGHGSVELYSLAEKFAGIDTLSDFLAQLKAPDEAPKIN